jgi:integrase
MKHPFYKQSHSAWYAEIGGKQIRLAKGAKDDETVKEAAFREYHRRMAGEQPVTSKTTVQQLCQQFLDWIKANRAERTHEWYYGHLESFVEHVGSKMVSEIKRYHVAGWVDKLPGGDNYKNGAVRAVSAVFNWAVKRDLLTVNPVAKVSRPSSTPREVEISDADWRRVLDATKDYFLDVLNFLDATGCRPQELRILSASHRREKQMILERKNSKGKRVRRVIRLNNVAAEIVERLAAKYPDGPLFRGKGGRPISSGALAQRFQKLREKLEIDGLCAYAVRHRWCQRALTRGLTCDEAGVLMGHTDGMMVRRVYGHLERQNEHLNAKLEQATQ